jgi:DNA-directed RNA polymerase III subunit RPC6
MFKAAGTQELLWCLKSHPTSAINKGDDNEERVVLGLIEEAGNKGIRKKDICIKSSLSQATLKKVLEALEGKKMIKSVLVILSMINAYE